jgi:hypothetical protein
VAHRRPLHQQRGSNLRLGRQDSSNDGPTANATAGWPSFTSPHGGREPAIKAKEPEAQSVGGTDGVVGGSNHFSRGSLTYGDHHLSPTTAATCPPTPHQRTAAAPKRTGRSSLLFSPQERERDRPGTRVPPSRRTTCCATPWCSRRPSPGWRTDSCTLSRKQQFAFPRMAGGRLLRRAGGCLSPPNAGGRSGSPAHAEAGPDLPCPPPQQG